MVKELKLIAKIQVCSFDDLNEEEKKLIDSAKAAVENAYSPYSGFRVGCAVLLENGIVLTGNNQENASFPAGICAERTAVYYAHAHDPDKAITTLAVAAFSGGHFTRHYISPCGICRQVLLESENRYQRPIRLLLYGEKEIAIVETIRDLLPLSFDKSFFI